MVAELNVDANVIEVRNFLKKLSTDEKDDVRPKIEQPDTTKITPLTEFKDEPKVIPVSSAIGSK